MKKRLELSLMPTTVLFASCTVDGQFGTQGSGGWGPSGITGLGMEGFFMWMIFLVVIALLIYFLFRTRKRH